MISTTDKRALFDWDAFVDNMNRESPVDLNETAMQKHSRITSLELYPEKWFVYYFSKYCTAEPADFHKASTRRVLNNPEWFEARPWSRELSKTGRTMMEIIYLSMVEEKKNWLYISSTNESATLLVKPIKTNLERNARLIHDYGDQVGYGSWTKDYFVTKKNVSFRAFGWQENPRGTRNDEARPDGIIFDDFDTDIECRNPDIVKQKWDWVERAAIGTRSISSPLLVIWNGNIIAENCCTLLAIKRADYHQIVNIRDKNGKSTWPQKNSEEAIDIALRGWSYAAMQGEYYNNPITEGKVFKSLRYGKIRPLKEYKYLVAYTDPSYKKKGDFKATMLVGRWKNEYHVIKVYCDQTTTAQMLDWNYEILKYVNGIVPVYFYIEWPWIDDMLKLDITAANQRHGMSLHPKADERDKPDKYHRIESTLEPLNRNGELMFNETERETQHMKNTEGQFLALSPTSRAHDDAPDAVEGAIFVVNNKAVNNTGNIQTIKTGRRGSKRI
ncbi:hypothetical protein H7F33_05545 [Pedobacter sp. PAMC26386]|nr:hypothetical protein H7F33_05545 [Pedobacter sp. PAMC26386]